MRRPVIGFSYSQLGMPLIIAESSKNRNVIVRNPKWMNDKILLDTYLLF